MSPSERRRGPSAGERQFALVLALLRTELGVTKHDILSSVHGYRHEFEAEAVDGVAPAKLDRKFERDKHDLRELGIDIETIDDPSAPGDNQLTRYRIREESARMPEHVRLDPDEAALVSLAAAVWREGSLADESRRGLMKLRARGIELRRDLPDIAPRLRMRDPAFDALAHAIEQQQAVAFDYRKPGSAGLERRRVEPFALVRFGGRWLLAGDDLDRGEARRFLLERIRGIPRTNGAADPDRVAARAGRDLAAETLAELRAHAAANPVTIEVEPDTDAAFRLVRHALDRTDLDGGRVRLELASADHEALADDLAGFGPELVVRRPDSLHRAVADRLRTVLADHEGSGA